MRILVLGASGMLGSAMVYVLSRSIDLKVFATIRAKFSDHHQLNVSSLNLITDVDVTSDASLERAFLTARPAVLINCVGVIKQLAAAQDPYTCIAINALLPHRLNQMCKAYGTKLVHISTDCVFSGHQGNYSEDDVSDCVDLYGRTKLLGEVSDANAVTLRTSIIGHEFNDGTNGVLGWFLSQSGHCDGYERAVFSGLPTVKLAHLIKDYVLPNMDLNGLYHVGAAPITKFDLLTLLSGTYHKKISIVPKSEPVLDRSLDVTKFFRATGYVAPDWQDLIAHMHATSAFWTSTEIGA